LDTHDGKAGLKSQFVISNSGRGGSRYAPYAFTEHGAIMAAAVLNSPRAVQVSLYVVRAFVQLRQMLAQNKELAAKLADLERKVGDHDKKIVALIQAIRELMAPPPEPLRKPIGFQAEK
jgi:acyl-coenzyme A synthetase/AMP-(fatty) acid ligase